MEPKAPLPPFARVHTEDTQWRNRAGFPVGREQARQLPRDGLSGLGL
jgi:nuclear transport factor 2 (NTF2) superfamily protein